MFRFFNREGELERELRASRATPSEDLVRRIEARAAESKPESRGSARVAVPAALTAAMLGALTAVGGLGYAASGVTRAARAVSHLVAPGQQHAVLRVDGATSGADQYQPGFAFGDPNHNHAGAPGLTQRTVAGASRATTMRRRGRLAFVKTSFAIDEQAHLTISVLGPHGEKLLLSQTRSKLGHGLTGRATKNVQYLVLVPRAMSLTLAIPSSLLRPGARYAVRIHARDRDGNVSTLRIPFVA